MSSPKVELEASLAADIARLLQRPALYDDEEFVDELRTSGADVATASVSPETAAATQRLASSASRAATAPHSLDAIPPNPAEAGATKTASDADEDELIRLDRRVRRESIGDFLPEHEIIDENMSIRRSKDHGPRVVPSNRNSNGSGHPSEAEVAATSSSSSIVLAAAPAGEQAISWGVGSSSGSSNSSFASSHAREHALEKEVHLWKKAYHEVHEKHQERTQSLLDEFAEREKVLRSAMRYEIEQIHLQQHRLAEAHDQEVRKFNVAFVAIAKALASAEIRVAEDGSINASHYLQLASQHLSALLPAEPVDGAGGSGISSSVLEHVPPALDITKALVMIFQLCSKCIPTAGAANSVQSPRKALHISKDTLRKEWQSGFSEAEKRLEELHGRWLSALLSMLPVELLSEEEMSFIHLGVSPTKDLDQVDSSRSPVVGSAGASRSPSAQSVHSGEPAGRTAEHISQCLHLLQKYQPTAQRISTSPSTGTAASNSDTWRLIAEEKSKLEAENKQLRGHLADVEYRLRMSDEQQQRRTDSLTEVYQSKQRELSRHVEDLRATNDRLLRERDNLAIRLRNMPAAGTSVFPEAMVGVDGLPAVEQQQLSNDCSSSSPVDFHVYLTPSSLAGGKKKQRRVDSSAVPVHVPNQSADDFIVSEDDEEDPKKETEKNGKEPLGAERSANIMRDEGTASMAGSGQHRWSGADDDHSPRRGSGDVGSAANRDEEGMAEDLGELPPDLQSAKEDRWRLERHLTDLHRVLSRNVKLTSELETAISALDEDIARKRSEKLHGFLVEKRAALAYELQECRSTCTALTRKYAEVKKQFVSAAVRQTDLQQRILLSHVQPQPELQLVRKSRSPGHDLLSPTISLERPDDGRPAASSARRSLNMVPSPPTTLSPPKVAAGLSHLHVARDLAVPVTPERSAAPSHRESEEAAAHLYEVDELHRLSEVPEEMVPLHLLSALPRQTAGAKGRFPMPVRPRSESAGSGRGAAAFHGGRDGDAAKKQKSKKPATVKKRLLVDRLTLSPWEKPAASEASRFLAGRYGGRSRLATAALSFHVATGGRGKASRGAGGLLPRPATATATAVAVSATQMRRSLLLPSSAARGRPSGLAPSRLSTWTSASIASSSAVAAPSSLAAARNAAAAGAARARPSSARPSLGR